MTTYDYCKAVYADVCLWIEWNMTEEELAERLADPESFREYLNDKLWIADEVTGNGSGSYTFCAWEAKEYICHNLDLACKAFQAFGCDGVPLDKGAEYVDVTIRCYLLGNAIDRVVEELAEGLTI